MIVEDSNGQVTSANDCNSIRARYGLDSMKVVRAADLDQLRRYDLHNRHTHWVLIEGAKVFHTSRFTDGVFEAAIQQALDR